MAADEHQQRSHGYDTKTNTLHVPVGMGRMVSSPPPVGETPKALLLHPKTAEQKAMEAKEAEVCLLASLSRWRL